MKLERIQEYVVPVVTTLAGMGFATYTGYLMGQGRISTVAIMLGLLFLGFTTMIMRQYIWLLMVVTGPWLGTIPALPVPFTVHDLGVMATFVAFLALIALKVVRRKPNYGLPDLLLGVLLFYVLTVFVRNPVGFLSMNSERVGGRPYFNAAVSCLAYLVLCRASIPVKSGAKVIIFSILASNYVLAGLNVLVDLSPKAARVLVNFYGGFAVEQDMNPTVAQPPPGEVVERLAYLGGFGMPTNTALPSFFSPLTLVNPLYLIRFLVLAASTYCLLLSGFRTTIITTIAFFAISAYIRSGWESIVRLVVIGACGLAILTLGQGRLYNLPLSAQRALSFLPGRWHPLALESARTSSEWRFYMWRVMLGTNKYIHNRLLGDGFGFTKRDMAAITYSQSQNFGDNQETTLVVGNVHSGPISTVRVVGYVGLVIHLALLVAMARLGWRLVRRAQGTPFLPLAFFVGLPIIYEPFNFVFIFGGFDVSLPGAIASLGMLKLVENTLNDYLGVPEEVKSVSERRVADPEYALAGASR